MDLFDAIDQRYSYRGEFTGERIDRSRLERIVQAGIRAPSGCNAQTTSFVIVDTPALVEKIGGIVEKPAAATAAAIIVCVMDGRPVYQGMAFGVEDCAAAVENVLLAITGLGYASVWLDGVLRRDGRAGAVAKLLGIPDALTVRVVLPLGVPLEPGTPQVRKPLAQRAWFNRFGGEREHAPRRGITSRGPVA